MKAIKLNQYTHFYFIFTCFTNNQSTSAFGAKLSMPLIQENDKILIIGDESLLFDGYTESIGFLSLIQKEINHHYYNVTIETISDSVDKTGNNDLYLQLGRHYDNPYNHPNISIVLYGTELIHTNTVISTHYYEYYYDKLLSLLNSSNTARAILLSTPLLSGERHDTRNKHDVVLEEVTGICQSLIKNKYSSKTANRNNINSNSNDSNQTAAVVSLLDIRHKMLKYIERNNIENLDHSCLTYDGYHFNPIGHKLVANEILGSLGFDISGSSSSNGLLNIMTYDSTLESWIDVLLQIGASTSSSSSASSYSLSITDNNYENTGGSNNIINDENLLASVLIDDAVDSTTVDSQASDRSLLTSILVDERNVNRTSTSTYTTSKVPITTTTVDGNDDINSQSMSSNNNNILGSLLTTGGKKQIFYRNLLSKSQHELNRINPHTASDDLIVAKHHHHPTVVVMNGDEI